MALFESNTSSTVYKKETVFVILKTVLQMDKLDDLFSINPLLYSVGLKSSENGRPSPQINTFPLIN